MGQILNIVTDLDTFFNVSSRRTDIFKAESWLFSFHFNMTSTDEFVKSSLKNYFHLFSGITFKSRIYVFTTNEKNETLFEVYRKTDLTIFEVCRLDGNKSKPGNGNEILRQKKNLSDVHFRIAYRNNKTFLTVKNGVS